MVRDSEGNNLSLFDLVVVTDVPIEAVAWDHDVAARANALDCVGKFGMITFHTGYKMDAPWHSPDHLEVNLQVKKFFEGEWSPIELYLPARCVRKISDNIIISYLFTELTWMTETSKEGLIFPAQKSKRHLKLFEEILATPLEDLEIISERAKDSLRKSAK